MSQATFASSTWWNDDPMSSYELTQILTDLRATHEDLAMLLGLTRGTITRYVNGRPVPQDTARHIRLLHFIATRVAAQDTIRAAIEVRTGRSLR